MKGKGLALAAPGALKGRRMLITGGGSGFGRALALAFAAEGALVAVCGRRLERLKETARASGGLVKPFRADVSDPSQVERLAAALRAEWGGLDVLVNNAGVLHEGGLSDYPLTAWRETLDANVTAPFLLAKALLPLMSRGGRIVNVTSGLGWVPMAPYGAYCVSKAALNMLGRVLALELEGRGILVNTADPGVAKTEMNPEATQAPETLVPIARTLASLPKGGPSGRFFKKSGEEIAP